MAPPKGAFSTYEGPRARAAVEVALAAHEIVPLEPEQHHCFVRPRSHRLPETVQKRRAEQEHCRSKNSALFLSFPDVCPEPVLVN